MHGLESALQRLETHVVQPFVAPILDAGHNKILVVQDDTPVWMHFNGVPGWWVLEEYGTRRQAAIKCQAEPHQYLQYLEALPRVYVVAVCRLAPHTWLCVPYNAADAEQRGWTDCSPRPLHLVRHSVEYPNVLDARVLGTNLLYADVPMRNLPFNDTFLVAREIALRREEELRRQAIQEAYEAQRDSLEHQVTDSVEFMGAQVIDWAESGENIRVTWEWNGYRNTTTVTRSLSAQTVGFCTAGTDALHNLTSAVALLQEGVRQQHYAVYREEL